MGTPDFAVPTLDALVEAGHRVVRVIAQPDAPAGRGQELRSPPVALRARELDVPLSQPRAVKTPEFASMLEEDRADVAVVVAYGRILTPRALAAPRLGCVNVHASLLPRWRGAAPIQWAILAGDAETGVCTQRMEEGLDTGPVYASVRTPIGPRETAGELHDRLSLLGARIAVDTLAGLPDLVPVPQPDGVATWANKVDREMARIRWDAPAVAVDRRVRAVTPWPGAWVAWEDGPLQIKEVRPLDTNGSPGVVLSTAPLVVGCGEGAVELVSVQAPGRRAVSGADFANGARLEPGAPFTRGSP
jgi:methionyl-tRNA formyltransferase